MGEQMADHPMPNEQDLVTRWAKQRLYVVVQDLEASEERLVRQDGAYGSFPSGTLLPWAKAEGIKLAKELDEPGRREFTFLLDVDLETRTRLPNTPRGYFGSRSGALSKVFGHAQVREAQERLGERFHTIPLIEVARDIAEAEGVGRRT